MNKHHCIVENQLKLHLVIDQKGNFLSLTNKVDLISLQGLKVMSKSYSTHTLFG